MVENKAEGQLRITIEEVEARLSHELGADPGLVRTGWRPTCRSCWPTMSEENIVGRGLPLVRQGIHDRGDRASGHPSTRDAEGRSVASGDQTPWRIDGVGGSPGIGLLNRDSPAIGSNQGVRRPADQAPKPGRLPRTAESVA